MTGIESTSSNSRSPMKIKNPVLPSWSDNLTRTQIISYVKNAVTPGSLSFIPIEDRIAVFDNDGTLWTEKPLYTQLQFTFDRVKRIAPAHPEWQAEQPFKAILENDHGYLHSLGETDIVKIVNAIYANVTESEFEKEIKDWLTVAKHIGFHRKFPELAYEPMIELIHYLKNNHFKVYIITGGGVEFVREISKEVYGIPSEQVIGSSIVTKFTYQGEKPDFIRAPKIVEPINDGPGKPVNIHREIGKPPIIAVGNSNGDLEMLQYTEASPYPTLKIIVHHDDSKREYAYDQGAEKILDEAKNKSWLVVSMRDDFRQVFKKTG
jgi:phosphoglycolate phosphatase-like HAD superfamily hydrolase